MLALSAYVWINIFTTYGNILAIAGIFLVQVCKNVGRQLCLGLCAPKCGATWPVFQCDVWTRIIDDVGILNHGLVVFGRSFQY